MAWRKFTGVLAAALVGVLLLATPAFAAVQNLTLKAAHKDMTAQEFATLKGAECTAPFVAGMSLDGWHFIWPHGGDFQSVTLTFDAGSGPFDITINGPVGTPNGNGTWNGFFGATGNGTVKHLYLFAPIGWELKNGVGTGINGTDTEFQLSHTCPGTPCPDAAAGCQPPPCPQGQTCEPQCPVGQTCDPDCPAGQTCDQDCPDDEDCAPVTPTPTIPTTPPGDSTIPPSLPTTGSSLTWVLITGGVLIVGGTALLVALRRRRDTA